MEKNQKGERHEGEARRMKEWQTKQVESTGCQGHPRVRAADLYGAESEPEKKRVRARWRHFGRNQKVTRSAKNWPLHHSL